MNDNIIVRALESGIVRAADIPSVFAEAGIEYARLSCLNWPDAFPYMPEVRYAIAHSGDVLYIHYKVCEDSVKGEFDADFSNVWEDSCCELFISPSDDGKYYNLECNCIGALYFCVGEGRSERRRIPETLMACIDRYSSFGRRSIGRRCGLQCWELALKVPAAAFFEHDIKMAGAAMKANIYKCGKTEHNHFVSCFPITTENPDFHRPEFFGNIIFE